MVSSWEPAHSLVEDAGLWGRRCPLPSISSCRTLASLPWGGVGRGLYTAFEVSFGIHSILCSPFQENELPFWVPCVLCQYSEIVLWKLLSIHMIF